MRAALAHKGWHWYRIHKKAEIYIGVPAGKKDRKSLIKKSINQLPVRMPRLNGGEVFFFCQQKYRYKSWRLVRYR